MSNASDPPDVQSPTEPGTILAGKYRVERLLGKGGMGVVVEARHIALDERVALKFLLPEFAVHPDASERFQREARNAVKIKSEHVARVRDVGVLDTGAPYMVMEYLEGRDLAATLQNTGVFTISDAIDYIIQGCEAIGEAHSYDIVHRDIKPANLFLAKRPDGSPIIKVLDFGISRSGGPAVDNLTKTTAVMGSALYMSPEQMQATRSVDHRTDIYALGISLYELLAGRQPFYADTMPQLCIAIFSGTPQPIRELRGDVPPELAAVIERAYARERGDRYQSVGELVLALAPYAPSRSRPVIERIARLAGLPIPEAQPSSSSGAPPQAAQSGGHPAQTAPTAGYVAQAQTGDTQMLPEPAPASAPAPPAPPAPVPPPPPSSPHQILPGHYNAPMSVRAAARFAQGGSGPAIMGQPRGNGVLIVVVVLGLLAIGGIAAAVALRSMVPRAVPPMVSAMPVTALPPVSVSPAASQTPSSDKPPEVPGTMGETTPPAQPAPMGETSTPPTSNTGHAGGDPPTPGPAGRPHDVKSAAPIPSTLPGTKRPPGARPPEKPTTSPDAKPPANPLANPL